MPVWLDFEQLMAVIAALPARPAGRSGFLAIDGQGGAGKSTLAKRVAAAVPDSAVVALDDFSGPRVLGWDRARFAEQVTEPLLAGRPARYQRWDWNSDSGAEWYDISPGGLIVVEGVSAMRTEVNLPWDLTVWVRTPRDVRLARGVERDGELMRAHWTDVWMPHEDAYVAEQNPEFRADVVIDGL